MSDFKLNEFGKPLGYSWKEHFKCYDITLDVPIEGTKTHRLVCPNCERKVVLKVPSLKTLSRENIFYIGLIAFLFIGLIILLFSHIPIIIEAVVLVLVCFTIYRQILKVLRNRRGLHPRLGLNYASVIDLHRLDFDWVYGVE